MGSLMVPDRLRRVCGQCLRAVLLGAASLSLLTAPARAAPPSVYATAETDLRFGRIVVFGSGTRIVTPAGAVTDSGGILSASGDSPGPSQISVGYDRGNEGKNAITVVMQVTFGAVPPVTQGGVTATITNLTSDLPGALTITSGQTVPLTINNCRTRQCGATFKIGGRLNVTRMYGGANISTPVPVSVTVVSVN
jgi:hypothetical protein